METATLTALLTRVRRMADVESFTARYPDAMLTDWINEGIIAYRELIGGRGSRVLRSLAPKSLVLGGWTLIDADCSSSTPVTGLSGETKVIDGITAVDGTRVLLLLQADATANGVWVAHSGAWTRPTDFPTGGDASTILVHVTRGTVLVGTYWIAPGVSAVIGTDELAFEQRTQPPGTGAQYVSLGGLDWTRIRSVSLQDDDSTLYYEVHEAVRDRDLVMHEGTEAGRPERYWIDGANGLMHFAPPSDRERPVRIVYEPSVPALASGYDSFQSLIPRGVEFVALVAAKKLLARDQNTDGYALVQSEYVECRQSILDSVSSHTGGVRRRRDTRSERDRDLKAIEPWVWPDWPD